MDPFFLAVLILVSLHVFARLCLNYVFLTWLITKTTTVFHLYPDLFSTAPVYAFFFPGIYILKLCIKIFLTYYCWYCCYHYWHFYYLLLFLAFLHCVACRILVPRLGIELCPCIGSVESQPLVGQGGPWCICIVGRCFTVWATREVCLFININSPLFTLKQSWFGQRIGWYAYFSLTASSLWEYLAHFESFLDMCWMNEWTHTTTIWKPKL